MTDIVTGRSFRAALVTLCSGRNVSANVRSALDFIHQAASSGAIYVQTPECTTLMELERPRLMAETLPEKDNPALAAFTEAASNLQIWLHVGSMGVKVGPEKLANRSYVFAPDGSIAARYDKIHMFDVDLGNGEAYSESANYQAGGEAVIATLPKANLGLTICYDLRFPALFRTLAQNGAEIIAVPAAFTRITGEAHWQTLLRARAIETEAFVLAAAQGGKHENGRETYGHSLAVSPWGEVLAESGSSPDVITVDIDIDAVGAMRRKIPSLRHDRAFTAPKAAAEPAI